MIAANESGGMGGGRGRAGQGGGGGFGGERPDGRMGEDVQDEGRYRARLDPSFGSNQAPNEPAVNLGDDDRSELSGAALTSLDIQLPARGADFFFKSPRGKAKVTVRPLETRSFTRWTSAIITIAVCVGVWVACWFVLWLRRFTTARALTTLLLLLAGLMSLVSSVLPVYGLLAVATAFVLFVDWLTNSVWLRNESTELG